MMILTIRTDNPEAEVGLYQDGKQLAYETWRGHRQLSATIHKKIQEILSANNLTLQDLLGVVVYKGPGSFTGLRIGVSVANALADGLGIPVAAAGGDDWISEGVELLRNGDSAHYALPEYGAPVNTTKPVK